MNKNLEVIEQREVLGQAFKIYGDFNNPLFFAKDVAEWIDYETKNTYRLLNQVEDEEKVIQSIHTLSGCQEAWFLTEDGLYEVLMQSRKPIAKAFKKEVKKILKQIRMTGAYGTPPAKDSYMIDNPVERAKRWIEEEEQRMVLLHNVQAQKQIIEEYKHKVDKYNSFLDAEGLCKVTNIADMFGLTAIKLNKILESFKIQYKKGQQWSLYADYKEKGFAQGVPTIVKHHNGETEVKYTLKWTSRGVDFIASKLESIGFVPVVIRNSQQLSFS